MPHRLTRALPGLVLALASLLQSYLVVSEYALKWIDRIREAGPVEAQSRGARLLLGATGAQYLEFLRQTVPEDHAVVLPEVTGNLGQQNILQFYLLPRGIPACRCELSRDEAPSEACRRCLLKEGHAVPAIGDFPPPEVVQGHKRLVPFDGGDPFRGVYTSVPAAAGGVGRSPTPSRSLAAVLTLELGPYLLLFLLGCLAIGTVRTEPQWGELLALGLPIGIGLETFTVFLAGWAGLAVTPLTYGAAYLLLLGLAAMIRWRAARRLSPFPAVTLTELRRLRRRDLSLASLAAMPVLLSMVISVGRAYSTFDGIANWALKGYAIAYERSIFAGQAWGGHGLAYPQNLALLIGMLRAFSGDLLPGSKLVPSLMLAALTLGCYLAWRRGGLEGRVAAAGSVAVATIPAVFIYSTLGFANLPFSAYMVLGTLWCVWGLLDQDAAGLGLGCLLLGFAAWTRPEGVGFAMLLLLALLACNWRLNRGSVPHAAALLPLPLIAGLWIGFGHPYIRSDEAGLLLGRFFRRIAGGEVLLAPAVEILRYYWAVLWRWHTWGVLAIWLPPLAGLGLVRLRPKRRPPAWMAGVAGLVAAAIPFGMFVVAAYSPGYGEVFLDVSFDRALFPGAVLLIWTAVYLAAAPAEEDSAPQLPADSIAQPAGV